MWNTMEVKGWEETKAQLPSPPPRLCSPVQITPHTLQIQRDTQDSLAPAHTSPTSLLPWVLSP